MNASETCLALIFTVALACDDAVHPPDTPAQSTYGEAEQPGTVPGLPDGVDPTGSESGETESESHNELSETQNEFCLPFEIAQCHSTTGRTLIDCAVEDCYCQLRVVSVDYAPDTAACLNLACPKHYPNPGLLVSCYHDWYSEAEDCFRDSACADWAADCPDYGATHRLRFLRSCLGG